MTAGAYSHLSGEEPGFVVRLEEFSGPLDLLLHLIREQEIDIADIPIAQIADQFVEAIHALGLNQAAEYLEMAARLLRIKLQMLLPMPVDAEAWEDPRAELVRRLLEYEQIRELVGWMVDHADARADRFGRGWTPPLPEREPEPPAVDLSELLEAVERVVEAMPQPILHRVVARPLDVEGATRRLRAMLAAEARIDFHAALGERPTPADVISLLLAVLELARLGEIRIAQRQVFGAVGISRGPSDQAA